MFKWTGRGLAMGLLGLTIACSDSNNDDAANLLGNTPTDNMVNSDVGEPTGPQLQFNLSGIEPALGQHYEGWVIGSGGVFTTGRFNVTETNQVVSVDVSGNELEVLGESGQAVFTYDEAAGELSTFVLTIEPNNDPDPGPSSVHLVGGDFVSGVADNTTDHRTAIGASFFGSTGGYILATPTNTPATNNQGIWFLDPSGPTNSLSLPALNTGWAYEGWVVDMSTGEPISTGIFTSSSSSDSDGPGSGAGPNPAPPFPGQDFITPARVLNDGQHVVVISVEPFPDFDPRPFTLKILASDIANNAPVGTLLNIENNSNEADIQLTVTEL